MTGQIQTGVGISKAQRGGTGTDCSTVQFWLPLRMALWKQIVEIFFGV